MIFYRYHFQRISKLLEYVSFSFGMVLIAMLLLGKFLFGGRAVPQEEKPEIADLHIEKERKLLITNPAVLGFSAGFPIPEVETKFSLISKPPKPLNDKRLIAVRFGQSSPVFLEENVPVFLRYEHNEVATSEEKSPFSLLFADKVLSLSFVQGDHTIEKKIPIDAYSGENDSFSLPAHMECFPPDLVIQTYGGEGYRAVQHKYRLKALGNVVSIEEGDLLALYEDGLRPATQPDRNKILMRVSAYLPQALELEVWNETGLLYQRIKLPLQAGTINTNPEEIFSSIRMRDSKRVTCRVGKKTHILKEGDWVLESNGGWHIVQTAEEMDAYLSGRIEGSLFVFDGVRKRGGKVQFTGTLFDKTRSCSKSIAIAIQEKPKPQAKSRGSPPSPLPPSERKGEIISPEEAIPQGEEP